MESVSPTIKFKDVVAYAVAYGLWMICAAVGMVAFFQVRNTLNFVWPLLGSSNQWRWTLRPVNNFGLVFVGLLWLVYVIFIEQHLRTGVTVLRAKRDGLNVITPIPDASQNAFWRFLRRLYLDIVVRRFAVSFVVPVVILVIAWALQNGLPYLFDWLNIGIF
ncbi:MAG: hypothetical protein JW934_13870 [Anaerolineae bacterium]|nr:hypothetical protein [Anaerolineae bacterium]